MEDLTFKPAGAAFVAVVAALAPAHVQFAAPQASALAQEKVAREALAEAAARLGPATPFGELSTGAEGRRGQPAKGQLGLPFEE